MNRVGNRMHEARYEKDHVVYCDGACKGNGKAGSVAGIGVWWGRGDSRLVLCYSHNILILTSRLNGAAVNRNIAERCPGVQTNNRAELIVRIITSRSKFDTPYVESEYVLLGNCARSRINTSWYRTAPHPNRFQILHPVSVRILSLLSRFLP